MVQFKIMDGAMGSELIQRGLTLPNHIWSAGANIENPNIVQKIHKEYVDAGADYITCNTFRTTPRMYLKTDIDYEHSIHMAKHSLLHAVKHAKNASTASVNIIGSIAPLEDCYKPELFPGKDVAIAEFYQLGKWLADSGVDILLLETMNSIAETEAGLIGIENFGLPVWVSFVLKDESCLLSGDSLVDMFEMIKSYSVDCIMLNCNPLNRTKIAVDIFVDNCPNKWGVYPNLGIGEPSSYGNIHFHEEINYFISTMEKIFEKGASILGGCCGSSPEHISRLFELRKKICL